MRFTIIFLLISFIFPCVGVTQVNEQAAISDQERSEIHAVIEKETTEKIISIHRVAPDTVEVKTGIITPGRLEGHGQTFRLKRIENVWRIVLRRGLWTS